MKKFLNFVVCIAFALGFSSSFANATEKITVGATPVPHAEILEFVKPELKKMGYELEIKVFNDYVIPNVATDEGQLDANFFQHIPYLNDFNAQKGTKLVKAAAVHLEPMGVYSKKIKNLDELKDGDKVGIPNDPTNESRALDVLVNAGLIKVNDNALRTPKDIIENSKNLKFIEIEAAQVPRTLGDTVISVINTNFAMNAGLNPVKDALAIESKDSPYANILVVKDSNENTPKIKALVKVLNSESVKNFINEKYKGAIIPAF